MAVEPVFVDSNVVIAATLSNHPDHQRAAAYLDGVIAGQTQALVFNEQVHREFLVVLTKAPDPVPVPEAVAALRYWVGQIFTLVATPLVGIQCVHLVERYDVKGKVIHDANIVAAMLIYDVKKLATFNTADFKRFTEIELVPIP